MAEVEAILETARRAGAQQAEVFCVETEETPVKFEANRLKELNSRRSSGVALRVIKDGRIGFASSTRPGDVAGVVAAAIETAPFGPQAQFDFPAQAEAAAVENYDPATEKLGVDQMIETGQRLVDAVRRAESAIQCDAQIRRATGRVTLANSAGALYTHRSSSFAAWVHGTLIRGTDMLFVGDGDVACSPAIDLARIEETILTQLERSKRNAPARTAELPVIFTSIGVADALLAPLAMAFNGRLVHQGQSPLAGCLGEEKYDRRLTMYDDATMSMRPASRPADDEGVPSRRIPLIDNGTVRSFMYDLQTAGHAKTESTGSAARALTTQPSISLTNVVIEAGDTPFVDMVRGIREGIIVEELMGAGQGNVMGGDFSGNVLLGYKIENGEITGRVKNTIVAGNVHEALKRIGAIGSESRWVGGTVYTPPLLVERLAVSAESS